ncbi:AlbA family DNA-binding domain-containing protein [Phytohabitans suffuscus]|uniref:AlbA family DNA-binding domain-containing protein n=1 Tax=Phytohabitans suffuscus TaxID=624315 RepID=UPI0018D96BA5|nr:RNA-binding domain-containing protein [Phytohabitans suffuscus]
MTIDLAELLGTQEHACLEFKRQATDRNAIREAICALANDLADCGGGDLIIGVAKDGTPVEGVDVSDAALLTFTSIPDEGRILPKPSLVIEAAVFQGR